MKKISIIFVAIIFAMCFVACNSGSETTSTVNDTSASEDFTIVNNINDSNAELDLKELAYSLASKSNKIDEADFKNEVKLTKGRFRKSSDREVYQIVYKNQIYGYFTEVMNDGTFYYVLGDSETIYSLTNIGYFSNGVCTFDEAITLG